MIWIGATDTSVLYVNGTNSEVDGGVELWVSDTSSFEQGQVRFWFTHHAGPDNKADTRLLRFPDPCPA